MRDVGTRLLVLGAALALSGCSRRPEPRDLVRAAQQLQDATAAGRDKAWVLEQAGKGVRINDVVRVTLPASPPSLLRYSLDIPSGAHLAFACGIPKDYQERPAVEFVVKVRKGGREETVWTSLVDPLAREADRRWVPVDLDLSKHAGAADLILETRGFEQRPEDTARAFWGAPALTVSPDDAPLAIVYLVDTLRADHTTPYGYERDTAPELARFAKDAVLFDAAIAQASWTKPSVASMLTSLLPGQHRAVQLRDPLDPGHATLAEMLQAKGFATGAAIANSVIYSEGSDFDQGFDVFEGLHGKGNKPSKLVEAAGVVDAALAWLDSRRGFKRFLYVHTMDPHVPYAPPPPFNRKYEPQPAPGHPGVDPRSDYKEPLDRERMIAQYDGDVAYGDQEFGRFVRELKARGLYDRALLVFMADHGEEFMDHGKWLHGRSVFDELVRIPLVVKFPGQRDGGKRIAQQVQEVDVLPTVLESLGLPVPAPPVIAGRPLQAVVTGGAPEPPAISEISHRGFVAHGMRTAKDKYVQRFSPEEDELYFDLLRDPKELSSRLEENPGRVRLLRAGVEAAMVSNNFRHALSASGTGEYVLTLRTRGWIEGVEATGLGTSERYALEGNGRRLELRLKPRPGQPREVAFSVRPQGAPVWLEGMRDNKPLRTADVLMTQEGLHPAEVPVRVLDVEAASENEGEFAGNLFAPPREDKPGIHLWLTLAPGRKVMDFDEETRERLKALGYLGPQ